MSFSPTLWSRYLSSCVSECVGLSALISGDVYSVPDSALTTSHGHDDYSARASRLNSEGYWSPLGSSGDHWLQVDFSSPYRVVAITTTGSPAGSAYITSYELRYKANTSDEFANIMYQRLDVIFPGNEPGNGRSYVDHTFYRAVVARVVRLVPVSHTTAYMGVRWELVGCLAGE